MSILVGHCQAGLVKRFGRGDITPPVEAFMLGETKPTPAINGAGKMPGRIGNPLVTIVGNYTIAAGEVLYDKRIEGQLSIDGSANPGRAVNCEIVGTAAAPTTGSARPLVQVINTPATLTRGAPQAILEFCTIRPQTASDFWDGVGRKNFKTIRCWLEDVNDGWQIFSQTADHIVNVDDEGSCLTYLVQFRPDVAYNNASPRQETHNDGIQNQGSEDEPLFIGTAIDARHSTTRSNPLPPTHTQLAAVMMNTNTHTKSSIRMRKCWLEGGIYTVNAGHSSGIMEFTDCRFQRPGTGSPTNTRALSLKSTLTKILSGNTYIDNGATVIPVNG